MAVLRQFATCDGAAHSFTPNLTAGPTEPQRGPPMRPIARVMLCGGVSLATALADSPAGVTLLFSFRGRRGDCHQSCGRVVHFGRYVVPVSLPRHDKAMGPQIFAPANGLRNLSIQAVRQHANRRHIAGCRFLD
jgi:hypothetical protein